MSKPPTTTNPPLFEPPELVINEKVLAEKLALPITPENFQALIASNYLVAMAGRDRKLARQYFDDLLVVTFNFQNRLVRISELGDLLEKLEGEKPLDVAEIRAEFERHKMLALTHQLTLRKTLQLFDQMRGEEDPVS